MEERELLFEIKGTLKGLLKDWPTTESYSDGREEGNIPSRTYYTSTDAPGVQNELEELVEKIAELDN